MIKVACIGSSTTWGAAIENRERDCYPAVLQRLLGDKYEVANFGENGHTVIKTADLSYCKTQKLIDAVNFRPDIVIIAFGNNVTAKCNWPEMYRFEDDYLALIDRFNINKFKPEVFIALPVPRFTDNDNTTYTSPENVTRIVHKIIKGIASSHNLRLIDFYTVLKDNPKLLPDQIHPNKDGAVLIAKTVFNAIEKVSPY